MFCNAASPTRSHAGGRFQIVEGAHQLSHLVVRGPLGEQPNRQTFQSLSELVEAPRLTCRDASDGRPLVRADLDEAFGLQLSVGLAQGIA